MNKMTNFSIKIAGDEIVVKVPKEVKDKFVEEIKKELKLFEILYRATGGRA